MTYEQVGAAIVAAIVFAWPKIVAVVKSIWGRMPAVPVPSMSDSVSYQEAIANLALVRTRLNSTGLLGDEKSPQRAAIDTLTLALVAGSDK
jgi:hypothetical protein